MTIAAKDKIRGVVYAYSPLERWDLVRELGTDWIRLNVPFPWADRMNGTVSSRWEKVKATIRSAHEAGLKVMPSTPTIFGYPEEICGKIGTPEFFSNVGRAASFMAGDLGECAPSLWQCMNELDGATFWQQARYITLPLLRPTIATIFILSIGSLLSSDFGLFYQVPMDSGALQEVTQTLDVYVYKALMQQANFSFSSAAAFLQSAVGCALLFLSNALIRRVDRDSALM